MFVLAELASVGLPVSTVTSLFTSDVRGFVRPDGARTYHISMNIIFVLVYEGGEGMFVPSLTELLCVLKPQHRSSLTSSGTGLVLDDPDRNSFVCNFGWARYSTVLQSFEVHPL